MTKKKNTFLSIGIPSMCIIFSVLCLVILALLTLGTSKQDLRTSQLTLKQTTAYYTACSAASQKYKELADYTTNTLENSKNQKDYNAQMTAVTQKYPDTAWNTDTQILSFSVDFTDEQAIYIEVNAPYPSDISSDFSPEIITWKTISTITWNPDTRQPVYKGDTK